MKYKVSKKNILISIIQQSPAPLNIVAQTVQKDQHTSGLQHQGHTQRNHRVGVEYLQQPLPETAPFTPQGGQNKTMTFKALKTNPTSSLN